MKWFKHSATASDEEFIAELEELFGWEGYGRWFKLLEAVSKQMDETDKHSVAYSVEKWKEILKCRYAKQLSEFLELCVARGELDVSSPDSPVEFPLSSSVRRLIVSIPKLLNLRDNHSKNLQAKNKSKDKEEDIFSEDKSSSNMREAKNQKAKKEIPKKLEEKTTEVFVLPDWLKPYQQDWDDWLEMRRKMRAVPTDRAMREAVLTLERLKTSGNDPGDVLKQSILNNYKGLFEVKHYAERKTDNAKRGFKPIADSNHSRTDGAADFEPGATEIGKYDFVAATAALKQKLRKEGTLYGARTRPASGDDGGCVLEPEDLRAHNKPDGAEVERVSTLAGRL